MAFGYALLKGCGGAVGYVRENGGVRSVTARDLPPFAACELYAAFEGGYRLCGTETADGGGRGQWTAPEEGALFLASGNKVLLWDGGDEAFLRASAWLKSQGQRNPGKTAPEETRTEAGLPAGTLEACGVPAREKPEPDPKPGYPFERAQPSRPESGQATENPPERAYFLRPAGKGEPVDTLPDRAGGF